MKIHSLYFQKKGAALIAVLGISTLILFVIQGLWSSSYLESVASHQRLWELRARYSARSSVELSLLRLSIYKESAQIISNNPLASAVMPYLNLLWSVPFSWPFPVPEDILDSEKKEMEQMLEDSFFKESYQVQIIPEDQFIDINDLASPIDYVRRFTFDTLLNLLILAVEEQEELKDKYSQSQLVEILNHISDWIDEDTISQNGGSEQDLDSDTRPPNRSFVYTEELQKVSGVKGDIYNILKPHVTIYGSRSLNINYASREILLALNISEILVDDILRRTTLGSEDYQPFQNVQEFCQYLGERNSALCQDLENNYGTLEVLKFNTVSHFRIQGAGMSRKIQASVEVLAYDIAQGISDYKASITQQEGIYQKEEENTNQDQKSEKKAKKPAKNKQKSLGNESELPFFIMYWKENI